MCSVLDDNDNPPEFMQSSFRISIPENLPPGVIHTAQASDPDHGENGTIHYSIVGEKIRPCFVFQATWKFYLYFMPSFSEFKATTVMMPPLQQVHYWLA